MSYTHLWNSLGD